MPHASSASAPTSAKTSTPLPTPSASGPATEPTEAQLLARESANARAAITGTIREIGKELRNTASPSAWMNEHPYATLATAALTGFVAVAKLVPSHDQQIEKHLRKMAEEARRAEDAENDEGDEASNGKSTGGKGGGGRHAIFSIVTAHFFRAAESLLLGMVTTLLTPRPTEPDPEAAAEKTQGNTPGNDSSVLGTDPTPTG